ncbi:hypothetical protein Pfo_002680 [Paulownia fortunei]|nr:hypothetical protein Pfo_002680 [Paulownia fortunei]
MATDSKEIALDLSPFFRLFSDGSIDRIRPPQFLPPSDDPNSAVRSKDVVIDPKTGVSVRIFAPRQQNPPRKLPLVVYIHGGAFCVGSASNPVFHNFVANLVEKANVIAVSVDYRLAPENPLPIPFDDSWAAFQWVAAHADSKGPDPWLNDHADFRRVFVGGESAGANIANDVAIRAGVHEFRGVEIVGLFLVHPFFGGKEEDRLYKYLCPTSSGRDDDPRLNPAVDPRIRQMVGRRVIFFVAEKDFLRDRGRAYYEGLTKSEWRGEVEIMETEGEGHCFYLFNLSSEKAVAIVDRLVALFNTANQRLRQALPPQERQSGEKTSPSCLLSRRWLCITISISPEMDSNPTQITHDFPPFFRIHNSGHIERYLEHDFVTPSHNPQTGVVSRDVVISPENNVSARMFLPRTTKGDPKLPLLIYIHGGAFSIQSAFSSMYHNYANSLASESRSVVISIEYRLAPEHPLPACYDDSYAVLKWVDSHSRVGEGPDPWLNEYADFQRVYVAGDSAGANIAHNLAIRANDNPEYMADDGLSFKFAGLILVHPFFGIGKSDKLWNFICPDTTGSNDFRLNPTANMDILSRLRCDRVLVCVAEKDFLRDRGRNYYEGLKKSDWKGVVEFFETAGEEHVFHLFDPACDKAISLLKRIVGFMNCGAHVMSHF